MIPISTSFVQIRAPPYYAWIFGLIFAHLASLREFARKLIHAKLYTNKVDLCDGLCFSIFLVNCVK